MRNLFYNSINTFDHIWNKLHPLNDPNKSPKISDLSPIDSVKVEHNGKYYRCLSEQQIKYRQESNHDLISIWKPILYEAQSRIQSDMYLALFDKEGYFIYGSNIILGVRCSGSDHILKLLPKGIPIEVIFENNSSESLDTTISNDPMPILMDYTGKDHRGIAFPIMTEDLKVCAFVGAGNPDGEIPEDLKVIGYLSAIILQYEYRKLLEYKHFTASLMDGIPVCAFLLDENARIMNANKKFIELLGYGTAESPSVFHFNRLISDKSLMVVSSSDNRKTLKEKIKFKNVDHQIIPCSVINQHPVRGPRKNNYLLVLIESDKQNVLSMETASESSSFEKLIGESQAMKATKALGKKAAAKPSNILIEGESGTGKELLAEAIHLESGRSGPFIPVNCGALTKELLQSELFGYEDGSFTGARKGGKTGLIEQAEGGTLFLDEIGEISLEMQVSMLRFLQNKRIVRVGGSRGLDVDVRIIAATNRNLKEEVNRGNFRQDLFYRLNVINIKIPPLRDRKGDIPLLVQYIFANLCRDFNMKQPRVTESVMDSFAKYSWPGNVRELHNVIESSLVECQGDIISEDDLPAYLMEHKDYLTIKGTLEEIEKNTLINRLIDLNGNLAQTAKSLGISRPTLYRKMNEMNIDRNEYRGGKGKKEMSHFSDNIV